MSKAIGGAYVATWLALTLAWLVSSPAQAGSVALVSGVLAFFLFVPGILGYVLARQSRRLRRAGIGTAVAFAIVPLVILVALAGTCVAIVPPERVRVMAPDPPPAPPVESSDTLDYLRRYGGTYTRQALDDRLREAGHESEAIAMAWDAVGAERHPQAGPGALATFLAIVGGLLVIVVFGGSAALGFLGASFSYGQSDTGSVFAATASPRSSRGSARCS